LVLERDVLSAGRQGTREGGFGVDKSGLDRKATAIEVDPVGKNTVRKVENDDEIVVVCKKGRVRGK